MFSLAVMVALYAVYWTFDEGLPDTYELVSFSTQSDDKGK